MKYNNYKCKVIDSNGKTTILYKQGESEQKVSQSFVGSGLIPLSIVHIKKSNNSLKHSNSKNVLEFTQIMGQLIDSGLSIKDSLEVTSIIGKGKKGATQIAQCLLSDVEKGTSFAESINNQSHIFPSIYRGIINVGDKIGNVEKIFPRLQNYLETNQKLKDKFKSALIYPLIVLFTAILGGIAMAIFVFPKLQEMFMEFGGQASLLLEQNINKLKSICIALVVFIVLLIIIITITFLISKTNSKFKNILDSFILRIPILGKFLIAWDTLNFSFAMETLTAGGVTIDNAITEAQSVIANTAYIKALKEVKNDLVKGISISESFNKHKEFPEYMSKWLFVGEKSGKPEKIFFQIRNYFQNYIDQFITKLMTLIEPILILLIGVFLISFILTVVVPIFSLYSSIL